VKTFPRSTALFPLLTLVGLLGCASSDRPVVSRLKIPAHVGPPGTTLPMVLAPLSDTRPTILRDAHEASQRAMYGFVLGYFIAFGSEEVLGADLEGDDRNRIELDGQTASPGDTATVRLDRYVAKLVEAAAGTAVTRSTETVNLGHIERTAAMVPGGEGFFIVPVLDQMDSLRMRRESLLLGGGSSSSTSGGTTTTTTTSGSVSSASRTSEFANVRLRLILGRVQHGQVVRTTVLYASGSGNIMVTALDNAAKQLGAGVERFLEDDARIH
jgi:hypothetical protein